MDKEIPHLSQTSTSIEEQRIEIYQGREGQSRQEIDSLGIQRLSSKAEWIAKHDILVIQ